MDYGKNDVQCKELKNKIKLKNEIKTIQLV